MLASGVALLGGGSDIEGLFSDIPCDSNGAPNRCFGSVLSRFYPNVLEAGTECQVNFLIFRFSDLHRIHPSGVARDRLGILDLVDYQTIKRSSAAMPA
jgi:hypothetical protein